MEEIEHALTKMIVQTVIGTAVSYGFTNLLQVAIPPTRRFKIAEMAGSVIAGKLVLTYEKRISGYVDMFYARRNARKLKLF